MKGLASTLFTVVMVLAGMVCLSCRDNTSVDQRLLVAAKRNNLEAVKMLVTSNADVNWRDQHGYSPLMNAILYSKKPQRSAAVVEYLLTAGAVPDFADVYGQGAIHLAAYNDCPEVIELLFGAGVNVNTATRGRAFTPLICAAFLDRENAIEMLLKLGADPNQKAHEDVYPLLIASYGSYRPLDMLLTAGADPNICGSDGLSPLLIAVSRVDSGYSESERHRRVRLLLEHKANPDLRCVPRRSGQGDYVSRQKIPLGCKAGETPREAATRLGLNDIVQLMERL
jgi:uncharacterized protein